MIALSLVIWLPLAVSLLAALLPGQWSGRVAAAGSLVTLGFAVSLLFGFDTHVGGLQDVTDKVWIGELGTHYKIGVDGLNLALVLLAALLFAAAFVAAAMREWERPSTFFVWLGLAQSAVFGALLAQDLLLFVAFFDLMLIPFYFLTGGWGGPNRVAATTKLVIYTLVGSLLMLAAAIATGVLAEPSGGHLSFVLSDLRALGLSKGSQEWIFLCFAAAFLVKMPAFPLHAWMPDGYRAMPLPVLAVFSGVLSKVGAYGFLRIVLPLFPQASAHYQTLMLLIALASILYGSVMAFTQTDMRLIVGYSSVAQLGFITLGIFALRPAGAQGAVLQMVNHGLVTAALFFIIGVIAARAGSEDIREMGGIAFRAPVLAALFLIVALATLAMPGSSNFVGEFLILLGAFQAKIVIAIVAFTGVVLASVYALRAFIRAMHNRLGESVESHEIGLRDVVVIAPLVLVILAIALDPQVALIRGQRTVTASISAAQAIVNPPSAAAGVPITTGTPASPGTVSPPAGAAQQLPQRNGGSGPSSSAGSSSGGSGP
ncbi:MAG: complex I subunit 4 family protein [Solirubrobacteraceae bacterium]